MRQEVLTSCATGKKKKEKKKGSRVTRLKRTRSERFSDERKKPAAEGTASARA